MTVSGHTPPTHRSEVARADLSAGRHPPGAPGYQRQTAEIERQRSGDRETEERRSSDRGAEIEQQRSGDQELQRSGDRATEERRSSYRGAEIKSDRGAEIERQRSGDQERQRSGDQERQRSGDQDRQRSGERRQKTGAEPGSGPVWHPAQYKWSADGRCGQLACRAVQHSCRRPPLLPSSYKSRY